MFQSCRPTLSCTQGEAGGRAGAGSSPNKWHGGLRLGSRSGQGSAHVMDGGQGSQAWTGQGARFSPSGTAGTQPRAW